MSGQGDSGDLDLTEYNGDALLITAALFMGVSWIAVLLRTYTRAILTTSFMLDDWFMIAAQLVFTASCVFILRGVMSGMGWHNMAIENTDDEVDTLMWQALATATYVLDMMLIKLSIGFFLLRLATQNVYRWILKGSLVVVVIWSTVTFFWDIFQCTPVQKQWDYRLDGGYCASPNQVVQAAYALSVMCVLSDWLYAILPVPMLWKVKMTKQAKATVIVILGLGVFASVATLIRLKFLADLEDLDDILCTDAMVWTLIEPGIAITAASMATIRPLLRRLRVRGFESSDGVSGPSYGHNSAFSASRKSRKRAAAPTEELDLDELAPRAADGALSRVSTFDHGGRPTVPSPSKGMGAVHSGGVHIYEDKESPASNSFEQIHQLEAQSQDHKLELSDRSKG